MKCGRAFFALFILIQFPQSLQAEGVGCAFGELPRNSPSNGLSIYTEFKNDSYSVLPKDKMDWDDLRSYGFFSGISVNQWRFGITADALIHRTENAADEKRIDELYFTADRTLLNFTEGPISGGLTLGAGIIQLGNLHSSWLQETTHAIYGTFRKMPMNYESIGTPLAFSGYISSGLKSALFGIPVEITGSIEGSHTGFLRAQTLIALGLLPGDPHWTVYAGNIYPAHYDSFGTVFAAVTDSEAGTYIGTTFCAGNLRTGFAYNIQTGRPAGYAALLYPKTKTSIAVKTETSMEFLVVPLIAGIRIRQIYRNARIAWSPCLGAESGPSGFDVGGGIHYRHSLVYLGMDMAYSFFDELDLYILSAIGTRIDQQRTCLADASKILKEATSQEILGEGGIRLFMPSSFASKPEWGIAIAGGMEYYTTIRYGFFPYFRLALVSNSGRPVIGQ